MGGFLSTLFFEDTRLSVAIALSPLSPRRETFQLTIADHALNARGNQTFCGLTEVLSKQPSVHELTELMHDCGRGRENDTFGLYLILVSRHSLFT